MYIYNLIMLNVEDEIVVNAFYPDWESARKWKEFYEDKYSGVVDFSNIVRINIETIGVEEDYNVSIIKIVAKEN